MIHLEPTGPVVRLGTFDLATSVCCPERVPAGLRVADDIPEVVENLQVTGTERFWLSPKAATSE